MRKEIKGVGMTAMEITYHETPDEIFAFFDEQSAQWRAAGNNNFERSINAIEEWAREELASRGFKDGNALRVQRTPLFAGNSLSDRACDYAVKVLTYIRFARKAIKDNNASLAARCGVHIGELFNRIQMTIEWEKYISGLKSGGHKDGGAKMAARALEHKVHIRNAVLDILKNKSTFDWDDGAIAKFLMAPGRNFQTHKGSTRGRKTMMRYIKAIRADFKAGN